MPKHKTVPTWHEPGHVRANYPLLKSNRGVKTCVKWDELENSESEEDSDGEETMACSMAMKDNDDEGSDIKVNYSNLSSDELFCTFEEIHEHMQRLLRREVV